MDTQTLDLDVIRGLVQFGFLEGCIYGGLPHPAIDRTTGGEPQFDENEEPFWADEDDAYADDGDHNPATWDETRRYTLGEGVTIYPDAFAGDEPTPYWIDELQPTPEEVAAHNQSLWDEWNS